MNRAIREIGVLFMTSMVLANRKGIKDTTRRMKNLKVINEAPHEWQRVNDELAEYWDKGNYSLTQIFKHKTTGNRIAVMCPYGVPGDLHYVKETYTIMEPEHCSGFKDRISYKADCLPDTEGDSIRKEYIESGYPYQWKSSLFMKKEYAREWHEVVSIGLERLRDISPEDVISEGIEPWCTVEEYFAKVRALADSNLRTGLLINERDMIKRAGKDGKVFKRTFNRLGFPEMGNITLDPTQAYFELFLATNPTKVMDINSELNNPWVWVIKYKILSLNGKPETV